MNFIFDRKLIPLTASFGVEATTEPADETMDDLFNAAERAPYQAMSRDQKLVT